MVSQLTRLQLTTKAADMVGRSLTGTTRSGATTQSILDEMYEWSQLRIARAFSFPELDERDTNAADTSDGVMVYSFSTLFGTTRSTKDVMAVVIEDGTSSQRLTRVLYRNLLRHYPYPEGETETKPTIYTRVGNDLWFFPVPDGTYDIHTVRSTYPIRASADSSTSDYDNKDDVLVAGTISEYFRHLQEAKEAAYWDGVFRMKLKDSVKSIIRPTDWEPEGRAFGSREFVRGDFWANPFVTGNPHTGVQD